MAFGQALEVGTTFGQQDWVREMISRAEERAKAQSYTQARREAQERIRLGSGTTPKCSSGAFNPDTSTWYPYSIPGIPGLCTGTEFRMAVR